MFTPPAPSEESGAASPYGAMMSSATKSMSGAAVVVAVVAIAWGAMQIFGKKKKGSMGLAGWVVVGLIAWALMQWMRRGAGRTIAAGTSEGVRDALDADVIDVTEASQEPAQTLIAPDTPLPSSPPSASGVAEDVADIFMQIHRNQSSQGAYTGISHTQVWSGGAWHTITQEDLMSIRDLTVWLNHWKGSVRTGGELLDQLRAQGNTVKIPPAEILNGEVVGISQTHAPYQG